MPPFASVDDLPAGSALTVVVGVFDGVHRGHLAVLRETVETARRTGSRATAITFDPHPEAVLRGASPPLLCDVRERASRLSATGMDLVVVQAFDREFASQTADAFLARVGAGRHLAAVVMTPESAFGRDRAGSLAAVSALAPRMGFEVVDVPPLELRGERISSSAIRELITRGRLSAAARLLARRYAVIGEVVRGDGRGRGLGFPTANLRSDPPVALPPNGIYAVRVSWGGDDPLRPARCADGVASLGIRPTFGGGARLLEVFLLDFDGDLYGERLRVEFVRRQRRERRFGDVGALVAQMHRDVERARVLLGTPRRRRERRG